MLVEDVLLVVVVVVVEQKQKNPPTPLAGSASRSPLPPFTRLRARNFCSCFRNEVNTRPMSQFGPSLCPLHT